MSSAEVVTIISALSVAVVSIITAWRTSDKVQKLTDNTERTATVADKKLDKIHDLTNSNLTTVKTDLVVANERIAKLEGLLQEFLAKPEGNPDKTNKIKSVKEEAKKELIKE